MLSLEKYLGRLLDLYKCIPTLSPNHEWVPDESAALPGAHKQAVPSTSHKTEKRQEHKIIVPATEHHPAQVASYVSDFNIGLIETTRFSAMVSPAVKASWLDRITNLLVAVKQARQRANRVDTKTFLVARAIQDYIHGA